MQSVAAVRVADAEQRIVTDARIAWSADRRPDGGLRGRGTVERFAVRMPGDSLPSSQGLVASVVLEALLDSVTARVTTRPLLANECDRPESAAAALAREFLVRVPDGVTEASQWRDSSATIVCRSGVPMTVYSVVESRVEAMTDDRMRIRRRITQKLSGVGGSAFRGFEIRGAGSGTQRLIVSLPSLTLLSLEGESRLELQVGERLPGSPMKQQSVTQRVELRAALVP